MLCVSNSQYGKSALLRLLYQTKFPSAVAEEDVKVLLKHKKVSHKKRSSKRKIEFLIWNGWSKQHVDKIGNEKRSLAVEQQLCVIIFASHFMWFRHFSHEFYISQQKFMRNYDLFKDHFVSVSTKWLLHYSCWLRSFERHERLTCWCFITQ